MAEIDHRILLAGRPIDVQQIMLREQALDQGRFDLEQKRGAADRAGQLRELFRTDGSAILQGNTDALGRLAALDPGLAQQAMSQGAQLDMQRQRLGLAQNDQNFRHGLAAADFEMKQRQASLESERKEAERALAMLQAASTPERWDQIAAKVAPELVGEFDSREELTNAFLGLKAALDRATPENPPNGYQWNGTSLEPIPGGPADPATIRQNAEARTPPKAPEGPDLTAESGLRKEWTALTKDFRSVRDAFAKVRGSAENPSAAGDLALIFNYMKMLDPGSVVREGEFATAQNAAGVPERVTNIYNRLLNGERLSPAQRQDFGQSAQRVFEAQSETYQRDLQVYRGIAERSGLDPERAIPDLPLTGNATVNVPGVADGASGGEKTREQRALEIHRELVEEGVPSGPVMQQRLIERLKAEGF